VTLASVPLAAVCSTTPDQPGSSSLSTTTPGIFNLIFYVFK
jgi:hypothetical protein